MTEQIVAPLFCDLCGSEIRDREKCLIVQPCVAAESFGGEMGPYGRIHHANDPCICFTCAGDDLMMLLDRYIKRMEDQPKDSCEHSIDGHHRWKHRQSGDSPDFFECWNCGKEIEK